MDLKEIIKAKSYRTGDFTLASGVKTKYFFDLKPTMLDPEGIFYIAHLILSRIESISQTRFKAIGGMATGGIPLVSAVCLLSRMHEQGGLAYALPAFFVRKVVKDHGTERRIEGVLEAGSTVVLVEDVTTTGGSIMEAVNAVRDAGCHVSHVVTIVDRLEGALLNLEKEGITLHPIFIRTDFD